MPKIFSIKTWLDEILSGSERYDIKEDDGTSYKSTMRIELSTAVAQAGDSIDATELNRIEIAIDNLDTKLADALDLLTTGGTSTAYTITTIGNATLATGEVFRVKFHTTAGASPTLNRDSKGAKTLKYYDNTGTKQTCGATNIIANMITVVIYDGTDYVVQNPADVSREVLLANRTYYVRTDGNDSNNGLTNNSGGAFLTIQKAINTVAALDRKTYTVTIQVGAGTYSISATPIILKEGLGSETIYITGDTTTPSNVVISSGAIANPDAAIYSSGISTTYEIKGFKFTGSSTYAALGARYGSVINFGSCDFGSGFTYHIESTFGSSIVCVANYAISGAATTAHVSARANAGIRVQNRTVTITNTPAFTQYAECRYAAVIFINGNTFSGSATGKYYNVDLNAVIQSAGATLPGNAAGTTATGGQYA